MTASKIWHEAKSGSFITLRPVLGGGRGFDVKLQTRLPVGPDYKREAYSPDILFAAERVCWLMENIVPGEWSLIPELEG
jgi:hypothetical protein